MKRILSFMVVVCLLVCFSMTGCAERKQEDGVLQLSHNALTVDVDNVLARLFVTYTGDGELTWSSSDPQVVEVDKHGFILGVAPGTAVVTCTDGLLHSQCEVAVVQTLDDYTLSAPRSMNLRKWQRKQLKITYTGTGTVVFQSSDPQVVEIRNGWIIAKAPGQAYITCTDGLRLASFPVTVKGVFDF